MLALGITAGQPGLDAPMTSTALVITSPLGLVQVDVSVMISLAELYSPPLVNVVLGLLKPIPEGRNMMVRWSWTSCANRTLLMKCFRPSLLMLMHAIGVATTSRPRSSPSGRLWLRLQCALRSGNSIFCRLLQLAVHLLKYPYLGGCPYC